MFTLGFQPLQKSLDCPRIAVCILLLICLFLHGFSWAQPTGLGLPFIKNFDHKTYQASAQNWAIAENDKGFIYFANNSGLLEYDGSTWRTYALPGKQPVKDLAIVQDTIYIAAQEELGYFLPNANGKLQYTSLKRLLPAPLLAEELAVARVHKVQDEIVFQCKKSLLCYKNKQFTEHKSPSEIKFSYELDGQIWLQDSISGLLQYENQKLQALPNTTDLQAVQITGITRVHENKWLLTSLSHGIFTYADQTLDLWETPAHAFVKAHSAWGATKLRDGYFLFNSILDGYIICDAEGTILQHLNKKKGLGGDTVFCSFQSLSGTIWMSVDNGIAQISLNNIYFRNKAHEDIGSVYDLLIWNDVLYAATNKGVYFARWKNQQIDSPFEFVPQTNGQVWKLFTVQNELYILHNRGVFHLDRAHRPSLILAQNTWSIHPTNTAKTDFILNTANGLYFAQADGYGLLNIQHRIASFDAIAKQLVYANGNVFTIANRQLKRMRLASDFSKVTRTFSYANAEKFDEGFDAVSLLHNEVVVNVNNRFYSWDFKTHQLLRRESWTKLFDKYQSPSLILEDQLGSIWFRYNDCVGLLERQADGKYKDRSAEISTLKGTILPTHLGQFRPSNNTALLGIISGIIEVDLRFTKKETPAKAPFIRAITTEKKEISWNRDHEHNYFIKIPYKHNTVRFTYTSTEFEDVLYSHRLVGYENKWSEWSTEKEQWYTLTNEGTYTFEVKAKTTYGESYKTDLLIIEILAPWYRQWWAYVLYALSAIALGIVSTFRIRKWATRHKDIAVQNELKQLLERHQDIKKRQVELESEIERLRKEKNQNSN